MLEAVAALPVRVLLTLGGVLMSNSVNAPANVTVREFVPHDLVLPYMATVISHGGLSTITTALTAGVPLLCIPQGRDQHYNAEQRRDYGRRTDRPQRRSGCRHRNSTNGAIGRPCRSARGVPLRR